MSLSMLSLDDFDNLDRDELVPIVSLVLLIGVGLVSGFDYSRIKQGATLLFYAVIIQIWTDMSEIDLKTSHLEFLMVSVGGVMVGSIAKGIVTEFSGEMLAWQALALAILISRFYVNSKDGEWIRWDDPVDRYAIYIPCAIALLLPVVLYQVEFTPILGYDPNSLLTPTRDTFVSVASLSVLGGLLVYGRIEKGWTLSS